MEEKMDVRKTDLISILNKNLNPKRYHHTLNVANEAVALAKRYGADEEKAEYAGLLHDFCRNMHVEELDQYLLKYDLEDEWHMLMGNRSLSHGKVAAHLAKYEMGIHDEEILDAIAYHTTGRKKMTLLDKIIYLADAIEVGRNHVGVEVLRKIAYNSLDEACLKAFDMSIMYILDKGEYLHPDTVYARNFLLKNK